MECDRVSQTDTPDKLDIPDKLDSTELKPVHDGQLIHIGIIPDGNRRWVNKNNKTREEYKTIIHDTIMNLYNEYKDKQRSEYKYPTFNMVNEISIYVLSKDNLLKRNDDTLILIEKTLDLICTLMRNKENQERVQIKTMGDISLLPQTIQDQLNVCTSLGKGPFRINFAIGYDPIDDSRLYLEQGLESRTPIDLVVRSGSQLRSSGFYPLQTLYSEWVYYDDLWPDITQEHVNEALIKFKSRQRNFGK